MKRKENGISARQFYALFFLSRIFGLLTFVNGPEALLSARNGSLLFLSYVPFTLLLGAPIFIYIKTAERAPSQPLRRSGAPGTIPAWLTGLYAVFFLLQAALGVRLLDRFVGDTMFQYDVHPVLILAFCALAAYTARSGIETVARAAPIFLFAALVSAVLITGAVLRYFEPENLVPLSRTDPERLLLNGLTAALRTAEPAGFLFLSSQIGGHKRRGFPITVFALGGVASLLFTLISGVTGEFGETQTFQLFTLTTVAELGTVERMDDVLCALWIFCAFIRTAFFLCLSLVCFPHAPSLRRTNLRSWTAGACVYVLYLLLSGSSPLSVLLTEKNGNLWVIGIFVFVVPLSFLIRDRIRKRRHAI